jgi:hypothetical protein
MFYLTDGPAKAHWLAADERDWLIDRLRRERMVREAHARHPLWEALAHPRVLVLSLVYFGTAQLSICAIGLFAIAPLSWTLPTAFLSGTAAAGGIARINSIGNLAEFAAPYAMGYLKDATGGFTPGLLAVAFFPFLSAILVLILGPNPALERGAIARGPTRSATYGCAQPSKAVWGHGNPPPGSGPRLAFPTLIRTRRTTPPGQPRKV